jgi:peptide/nickel transport system ATP-binding protein
VQAQILEVLRTARDVTGAGVLIITHDLGVVAEFADRALVMYAGRAVEVAGVDELYRDRRMPYTAGLRIRAAGRPQGARLVRYREHLRWSAAGMPVRAPLPAGHRRVPAAEPALLAVGEGRAAACIRT